MRPSAIIAVGASLVSAPAAAENPFKPGDFAVAVRHMVGGEFIHDASGKITGRHGYRIVETPPKDYEGTCWQVRKAKENEVEMCLVSGEFKPHWEDGKAYSEWCDAWVVDALFPFPTDVAAGRFSLFQRVDSCPAS